MNIQEIIDKNLKECFEIHNEKISDKYRPYLTKIAQEIHNNALDLVLKNVNIAIFTEDKQLHNVKDIITVSNGSYYEVNKKSIEQLKIK